MQDQINKLISTNKNIALVLLILIAVLGIMLANRAGDTVSWKSALGLIICLASLFGIMTLAVKK